MGNQCVMKRAWIILVMVGCVAGLGFWLWPLESKEHAGREKMTAINVKKDPVGIKGLIIQKLQRMVQEGSKGLYHLSVGDIAISVLPSKIVFKSITLTPDTGVSKNNLPPRLFKISLPSLTIEGIGVDDLLHRKDIDLKALHIIHPTIEVMETGSEGAKTQMDSATLYQQLQQDITRLMIKHITLQHATLINHSHPNKKVSRLKDVTIVLNDLQMDSTTQYDRHRFLFAKEASITIQNLETSTEDNLYHFKIGTIHIDAVQRHMHASHLALQPRYNKAEFQKHTPGMQERYELTVADVRLKEIDWWGLLNRQRLTAGEAIWQGGKVRIYLDRSRPPGKPDLKNFPHQLLMRLPVWVHIPTLRVNDFDLVYEEYNPQSRKTGQLHFAHLKGTLTHIANRPEELKKHRWIVADLSASFLGTPVLATLRFDMAHYKRGAFTASVRMDSVQLQKTNTITTAFSLMKARSGVMHQLKATLTGDNDSASGNVVVLYDDLKIMLLKRDNGDGPFKKRNIKGFLANVLVIKNANPSKGEPPREPYCHYDRDPDGSFFNLIWKTLLVGLLKTIGANPKLAASPP